MSSVEAHLRSLIRCEIKLIQEASRIASGAPVTGVRGQSKVKAIAVNDPDKFEKARGFEMMKWYKGEDTAKMFMKFADLPNQAGLDRLMSIIMSIISLEEVNIDVDVVKAAKSIGLSGKKSQIKSFRYLQWYDPPGRGRRPGGPGFPKKYKTAATLAMAAASASGLPKGPSFSTDMTSDLIFQIATKWGG